MKRFVARSAIAALLLGASAVRAEIVGPYTPDANTLYLFHFDEASGGSMTTNAGPKGKAAYSVDMSIATAAPALVTDMLGAAGYSSGGVNFGNCVTNRANGYLIGYDYDNSGTFEPTIYGTAANETTVDSVIMTNLNIGNGGQTPFTVECLVAPASIVSSYDQEIICTDNSTRTAGNTQRGLQFRITKTGALQFQFVGGASPRNVGLAIPTTGPHAFVANAWYHIACTYDGSTIRLYWTRLVGTNTAANLLTSGTMALGTTEGAVAGCLTFGNDNRDAATEPFTGKIDEVRISNVCRNAGQMQFYSDTITISPDPVSQNIDYGQPVTFTIAATSRSAQGYRWRFNGTPISGDAASNTSYTIPAVSAANAGNYDCVVTNTAGYSATSRVAHLTVSAVNFLAHRWSFTNDTTDSIGGATGTNFGAATVTDGALVLDGTTDTYMQLPAYLITNTMSAVTFEFWVNYGTLTGDNDRVFDFGDTNGIVSGVSNLPMRYLFFSPHSGANHRLTLSSGENIFEQSATAAGILDGLNVHVACVVDPPNKYLAIYTNGVLEVANTNMTISLGVVNNEISYIGRSLYYDRSGDAFLNASIDELRIYNGALSPNTVLLNHFLGATNLPSDGPVAIVGQPSAFTCAAGQTASFSVVADGRRPIVYQWFKNGLPITGATNASVSFTTVAGDNNASIQAWATNLVGATVYTASSAAVTLNVINPQNLTWVGASSGDWDIITANWTNGTALVTFADFDSVLFNDVGVGNQSTVNLTLPVNITGLSVNSASDYLLTSSYQNGSLSGQANLLKQGGGKFTIDVTNNCVGANTIAAGTLQVGNGGTAGGLNHGPITNNATLVFNRSETTAVATPIHGAGTLQCDSSVSLEATNDYTGPTLINNGAVYVRNRSSLGATNAGTTVAGGQIYITANVDITGEALTLNGGWDGTGALRKGGGGTTVYDAPLTLASDTTIGVDSGATLNLTNASTVTGNNVNLTIAGAGATVANAPISLGSGVLTKTGNGTLTLNRPNTFSGGVTLSGGVISVNTNGALSTGTVTCDSAGRLVLATGMNFTNAVVANAVSPGVATGFLMVNNNTNGTVTTISGPVTFNVSAANGGHFAGPASSGYLNVIQPLVMPDGAILQIRLGNLRFNGGGYYQYIDVRANTTSIGANNGIATNAVMDLAGNGSPTVPTYFDLNGFNQKLAGLKNTVTPANLGVVTNSSLTAGMLTLDLGEGNAWSFSGRIAGNLSVTLNSGTQVLTGTNAYTGNTTVNGGVLQIAEPTLASNSIVTLATGAILQLDFAVTNHVAGLVLNGVNQDPGVYDGTKGSPYITGMGSLLVGPTVANYPTNISYSVSGSLLTLSWPASHKGWILQAQTNSLDVGIITNAASWHDVTGSGSGTNASITIDSTKPTVFYRLRYP